MGLHGLRVSGYTHGCRGSGRELAVAHGGWESDAHERYDRFSRAEVLALPAAIVRQVDDAASPPLPRVPVVASPAPVPVPPPPPQRSERPAGGSVRRRSSAAAQAPSAASPARSPPRAAAVRALSFENAVGRRVLVPASLWGSRYACNEHGGEGWEAKVLKVRLGRGGGEEAFVQFVQQPSARRAWTPMYLQLEVLRPLA